MNHTLFHFRSLFFTIIVVVVLLLFANGTLLAHERLGLVVIGVLVVVTLFAARRIGHRYIFAFVPCGIVVTALALLYFIDPLLERRVFALGSSLIFYMALLGIVRMRNNMRDETARTLFSISIMTVLFFFYAATYGVYINFDITLWSFLLLQAIVLFAVTLVSLRTYTSNRRRIILYSIVISFAMMQLSWMINFWPFGYLTNAAISLVFYYVLWDMALMTFMGTLSKQRTLTNIVVGIILLLAVLLTSQWVLI